MLRTRHLRFPLFQNIHEHTTVLAAGKFYSHRGSQQSISPRATERALLVLCVCLLNVLGLVVGAQGEEAVPADVVQSVDQAAELERFEKEIRPLLVEKCQQCHNADKQQGGLRLDRRSDVFNGEVGPLVTPGQPDHSRLVQVVRYDPNDIRMPPSGKLTDAEIQLLTEWVARGAVWPEDAATTGEPGSLGGNSSEHHWAFQPLVKSPPPEIPADSPVDAWIKASLQRAGIEMAPPATRAQWLRRISIGLTGLPATFEEIQAFKADPSPDAESREMDRLLASPAYGQRWGRYWLDVARYADTKGYVFTEEPRYPFSYTYRDYVIDAFNKDLPYDRFVLEQMAGDQLADAQPADLAGMGFLTVGRRYLNNVPDIIDDRIDVICRGLMGLTVGCARCHDHKYDPIPTADYYSLYGVFASSVEPSELPALAPPAQQAAYAAFQAELAVREQALAEYEKQTLAAINLEMRNQAAAYLLEAAKSGGAGGANPTLNPFDFRRFMVEKWEKFIQKLPPAHPVWGPWQRALAEPPERFSTVAEQWRAEITGGGPAAAWNARVRQQLVEKAPANLAELAAMYERLLKEIAQQWEQAVMQTPGLVALADPADEELRHMVDGEHSPFTLPLKKVGKAFRRDERDQRRTLQNRIEELNLTSPGAPPRAMVMHDAPEPVQAVVFLRGNPDRQGPQVPRQFLQVVSGSNRQPFQRGSGRLELAQAVVDRSNPLTPRVLVNRLWKHHFGTGLVATTSDFGVRGSLPTHPELLDWLALELQLRGWSIKAVQRAILQSAVYRQTTMFESAGSREIDPENRLLWRFPRQRLDLEAWRDGLLSVAGRLDVSHGGRSEERFMDPASIRRTVYSFVDRNDLPGVFRAFDFADPDLSTGERPQTTVPQQALFGLNSPFVIAQSQALAARVAAEPIERQVPWLYQAVLAREPSSEEQELGVGYLSVAPAEGALPAAVTYAQALLLSNEFAFVD